MRADSDIKRDVEAELKWAPDVRETDIAAKVTGEAFRRNATIDAQKVAVDASGSEVTLRGEVRSWAERDQAQQTAWAAPGVLTVKNEITVRT